VRLLQDRVEHRSEIAGRTVDDLEDLGGRGLLFQCLTGLGDQPGILDRNDRLVGKGAHQLNLPLGEWLDPLAGEVNNADRLALAE
jgi:hypothetical protein